MFLHFIIITYLSVPVLKQIVFSDVSFFTHSLPQSNIHALCIVGTLNFWINMNLIYISDNYPFTNTCMYVYAHMHTYMHSNSYTQSCEERNH